MFSCGSMYIRIEEKEIWGMATTYFSNATAYVFVVDEDQKLHFLSKASPFNTEDPIFPTDMCSLQKKEKALLKNNIVTFVCMFMSNDENEREGTSTQTAENFPSLACMENLSLDLQHLLDDGRDSDVSLLCGELSIPAHKIILCTRSKVFHAMLHSNMKEKRSGIIEISDVKPSTLVQLVKFIYSGKVSDISMDSAQELYAAAEKYDVYSLKQLCSSFIKDNLSSENVCNVLELADVYGDKEMKDIAISFIVNSNMLQDEEKWQAFRAKRPQLSSDVLYSAYKAKCSADQPVVPGTSTESVSQPSCRRDGSQHGKYQSEVPRTSTESVSQPIGIHNVFPLPNLFDSCSFPTPFQVPMPGLMQGPLVVRKKRKLLND